METLIVPSLVIVVLAVSALAFLLHSKNQQEKIKITGLQENSLRDQGSLQQLQREVNTLQEELKTKTDSVYAIREENVELKTALEFERKQFDEKIKLVDQSKEQLGVAFKNIANEIFDDKSKKLEAHNKTNLSTVLQPLQEKITRFEKRVEETYDKESKERFSLANEIKNLTALNTRISEDAVNLTNALKGDNKTQGNWGELVLETILENSGLVKGREYEIQVALKSEDGAKLQPDVVVHLPESRDIIIDSKVSLKAWDAYCSADTDEIQAEALKAHIQSLRSHVKLLSAKDYQNLSGVNSLDYVFLFMPIESAYAVAMQHDKDLFQYAFERNIVFVVPTTLLTSLRTVQNLWRLVQQNKNAQEIADKAGALYDKFVAFVDDVDEVGNKIDASRRSFEKAQNKLLTGRGNLIKRAETLKELGAKTSKQHKAAMLDSALENERLSIEEDSVSTPEQVPESDTKTQH